MKSKIKILVLVLTLPIFFAASASAQSNQPKIAPANFKSDGCSWFPDGKYLDCCVQHDLAYFSGGSWTKRWRADKKLFKCVAATRGFEHKFIAPVMWLGVRAGGVSWLPTRFRWGFGRVKKSSK